MFWLSHHPPEELDRAWTIGGVHVCARCLGTYPVLFAAIAAQFAVRAPLDHPLDIAFSLGLLMPALFDWAYGRFRPPSPEGLMQHRPRQPPDVRA